MKIGNETRTSSPLQSVDITLNIIEHLQHSNRLGVTELADELGHSKSTIHDHLRTLEQRELVVSEQSGYRLSLKFLDITTQLLDQIGNYDAIQNEVDKLADETGEIAQFGIEEFSQIIYIYKAADERAVETRSRLGMRQPLYSTALGKVILAHMPSKRVDEIIQSTELTSQTPATISDSDALREALEQVKQQGYAVDDEENIEGLRCVAAPVKNETTIFGAISVSGPLSRFDNERVHNEVADSVQRAANIIELNTKFSQ